MKNLQYMFALPAFALLSSSVIAAPAINKDYVAVSAFSGYRFSDDIKDTESGQHAKISDNVLQALSVAWYYGRNTEGEILVSNAKHNLKMDNKSANLNVHFTYLQFGGRILFVDDSHFSQSLGLGIGATFMTPSSGDHDTEVVFSGNITGGVRYELADNWAVKADLRVYGNLLNNDSSLFCSNNQCLIKLEGDVYVQTELLAGLEYKF